jgi:hypothetical protein
MDRPFTVMFTRPLGKEVPASQYAPLRPVIGEVSRSQTGNLIIRAGREIEPGGAWEKVLHIVLTPDEARDLVESIGQLLPETVKRN